jgi:hypothetical protein
MRSSLLLAALALAALAPAPAAFADYYNLTVPGKGTITIRDDRIVVLPGGPNENSTNWRLSRSSAEEHTTTIHCSAVGMLTFDPDTGAVSLAKQGAPRREWKLTWVRDTEQWLIQATEGKYKGWYLDVEDEPERKGGPYRLKLSKKPGPNSKIKIVEVGQ